MPWRLAERSRSTASWPLRATPLPSRSIRARWCLAIGRLASAALRYHSTARAESRSTTKPRSYITPTLKADWAEPCWAARSSQPAPACWSLATPTPCTRRRAISSMAGISSALALVRSSSIGKRRPVDRSGRCGGGRFGCRRRRRRLDWRRRRALAARRRRPAAARTRIAAGRLGRGWRFRNHERCRRARRCRGAAGASRRRGHARRPRRPAASATRPRPRAAARSTPPTSESGSLHAHAPTLADSGRAGEGVARWRTTIRLVSSRTAPAWCAVASGDVDAAQDGGDSEAELQQRHRRGRQRLRPARAPGQRPARPAPGAWPASDGRTGWSCRSRRS